MIRVLLLDSLTRLRVEPAEAVVSLPGDQVATSKMMLMTTFIVKCPIVRVMVTDR